MRRLTQIRAARLDAIIGSNRNIERLLEIAIEIAHQKIVGAIRLREPSLERTGHAGTELPRRADGELCRHDDTRERESSARREGPAQDVHDRERSTAGAPVSS